MKELLVFAVSLIALVGGGVFVILGRSWLDDTLTGYGWTLITFVLGMVFGQAVPSIAARISALFKPIKLTTKVKL